MVRTWRNLALVGLVCALHAPGASAQWSSSTTNPLIVGDAGSNIPMVVPTSDGGCYIAWQGTVGGGQYNTVHLQRLSAAGVEMWPHNGIVAVPGNNSASFVGDFDLAIASDGDALIVNSTNYSDPANPTVHQANVQKFAASDGHKVWGTGGADVAVTASPLAARPVHVCPTPDGGCIVGYTLTLASGNGAIRFMRMSPAGAPAWTGTPPTVLEDSGNTSISLVGLQPADTDGSFVALWGAGVNTNTVALHTQKFTGAGALAAGWGTSGLPLVLDTHGLTGFNYYHAKFVSDGAGGAVYAWSSFANSGFGSPTAAFLQHILSSGAAKFIEPIPSVNSAFDPMHGQFTAALAYNQASGTYFVGSEQGPISNGTLRSALVQKFDTAGNRLWTETGFTVVPESTNTQIGPNWIHVTATSDGGCLVFGTVGRGVTTVNRVVYAAKVLTDGSGFPFAPWNKFINTDATTDKGRMGVVTSAGSDDAIVAYTIGDGSSTLAAVRVSSATGDPGVTAVAPAFDVDLPPTVSACDDSTITLSVTVSGTPNIVYRWQRHYADALSNPGAYWNLNDGDNAFQCIVPDDGTTYSGTGTATLTIHNVHALPPTITCTNGTVNTEPTYNAYRCVVFNAGTDQVLASSTAVIVIDNNLCCAADFNHSGSVSVQDIFDFLSAYFSAQPAADINNSGSITVQDIFDFLAAYFAGC